VTTTRGKTEIRSFKVEELLDWAKNGRLRVPNFQRRLRWDARNVVELFDSMYNSYPIGTLLLAKRKLPPESVRFGPVSIGPKPDAETHWIIDGQQRLTSIIGTLLHPEPEPRQDQYSVYFDLESERFFIRRKREVPATSIPLRELRDSTSVLSWLRHWPLALERADLEPRVFELSKVIREFTVAAAIVEGDDVLLRSIFVRTNRSGVEMVEAEVFEALYGISPEQSVAVAAARLSSGSMGEIEPSFLLRCAKHVAGTDPGERPEDLGDIDAHFVERAETALQRVLVFLSDDCGLPHLDLVHQRFPLIPLTRYFAFFPHPSTRARRLLRRWVWRGLLNESFNQTGFGPVRAYQEIIAAEHSEESVAKQMLERVGSASLPEVIFPDRWSFRSREVKLLAAMLFDRLTDDELGLALKDLNKVGQTEAGHFEGGGKQPEAWLPIKLGRSRLSSFGFGAPALHALDGGDVSGALTLRRVELEQMLKLFLRERCEFDQTDRVSIREMVGTV